MGRGSSKIAGGSGGSGGSGAGAVSNAEKMDMMEHYVGPEGFDMNVVARGIPLTDANSQSDYSESEVRDMVDGFERVLDSESLPSAERVYRGATYDSLVESTGFTSEQISANPDILIGKTITERGFMSTTHSYSMAEDYAQGDVVWRVDLPEGAKAVHQNKILKYLDGDEITVQRNSQLKVDYAYKSDGLTIIQAHYTGVKRR